MKMERMTKYIPGLWLTLILAVAGIAYGGQLSVTLPQVAAGLSGLDSLIHIDKTVGGTKIAVKNVGAVLRHPLHPNRAIAKMKSTNAVK